MVNGHSFKVIDTVPERQGIQSLEIGIRVYQTLATFDRPLALRELAAAVDLHPAKLHRYLVSLVRTGLVSQDDSRRYSAAGQARAMAAERMTSLCRRIGETVFLSRWATNGPVILQVEEPPRPVSVRPTATGELPLCTSATGRAFAAHLPPDRLRTLVAAELPPRKRTAYLRELEEVRRRGVARSLGERYPGLNSFSAPILDARGEAILALTAFGLESTFPAEWESRAPRLLKEAAGEIGRRLQAFAALGGVSSPQHGWKRL
jgi:DNA-binding IclR family transcriptional regulator